MKVCVYGAGAIGGHIAGHLARADVEVSVIARGPHLEAMQRKGLRVVTPNEDFTVPVKATGDASELGPQDYVFITLKSHQVTNALDAMQPLLGPDTAVIPPTTGIPYWYFYGQPGPHENLRLERLDPSGRQWEMLRPERAIGCVFWTGAEVVEPGVVRQDGAASGYPIGEPDGSESERIVRLSRAMYDGGLKAPVRRAIRGDLWIKMINSMCWNPVAALCNATNGEIAEAPDVVDVVRRMMKEAETVAEALGVEIPVPMEKRVTITLGAVHHKMSMLQDLERGRPIELDVLAESIATMRELAGLETPTIDAVLSLVRLRARHLG